MPPRKQKVATKKTTKRKVAVKKTTKTATTKRKTAAKKTTKTARRKTAAKKTTKTARRKVATKKTKAKTVTAKQNVPSSKGKNLKFVAKGVNVKVLKKLLDDSYKYVKYLEKVAPLEVWYIRFYGANGDDRQRLDTEKSFNRDAYYAHIQNILMNGPVVSAPLTVFRGIAPEPKMGTFQVGDIIDNPMPLSTSYNTSIAGRFAGLDCCFMTIHLPAGTHAFVMEPIEIFPEMEIVLPIGTSLLITKRDGRNIEAECVACTDRTIMSRLPALQKQLLMADKRHENNVYIFQYQMEMPILRAIGDQDRDKVNHLLSQWQKSGAMKIGYGSIENYLVFQVVDGLLNLNEPFIKDILSYFPRSVVKKARSTIYTEILKNERGGKAYADSIDSYINSLLQ